MIKKFLFLSQNMNGHNLRAQIQDIQKKKNDSTWEKFHQVYIIAE